MRAKEFLSELSTEKLAQYKKAAHADAKQADSEGDYARGDKRFKGINKATIKQFDNDLKKHNQQGVAEATPRHFGPKGAGTELARQIRANGELDRNKQPKPTGIPKKNEFNITEPKAKIQVKKDKGVAEDWNKVNHHDHTDGLSQKAVNAYRHEHPGSKLKTAVTTKPSKLKAGSKDAKRRKSFCARMSGNKGPMKDEKGRPTPKAKALHRWNCE